ncbi:MAG: hypothetical protein QW785_02885, partial [Candidatus Anstonellales archaeon]
PAYDLDSRNVITNSSSYDFWIYIRVPDEVKWITYFYLNNTMVNQSEVINGTRNISIRYSTNSSVYYPRGGNPLSNNNRFEIRYFFTDVSTYSCLVGGADASYYYGLGDILIDIKAPEVYIHAPDKLITTSSVNIPIYYEIINDIIGSLAVYGPFYYDLYVNQTLVRQSPNSFIATYYNNTYSNQYQPGIYNITLRARDQINSNSTTKQIIVYGVPGSSNGNNGINGNSSYSVRGNFSSNVSNNDYWIDLRLDSAISWNVTLVVDGNDVNSSVGSGSSNVSLGYTHPASRNSTYRFRVNYSVGGSSVVVVYGPYNAWIDLIPPTLNISWPRPGESYTEGIRTFEFYVEDDFAQVLTCSYLFTGPNAYNNTVQVQNGSTYSINLEFSRGNYYINVECSDGVNSVVESYQFNIRRSGGNEQPPQDESPPQQQETPPTDQQNQSSTDQNVTTGTIETDSNTTITNIDLNTSIEITTDSSTSDQEQPTPSSIIIQDQSNRDRTTVETEQSSETNQQIVIIPDMERSERTINLERSDAETDSNNQQVQSDTELKEDSTDRNNLMNVNRVINSVAVVLTSPQSLAGLLGVGVSIILLMLRTVKLTIVRGERNMILLKNLFNKPVKGVKVRILDKEFQSDENGMVVTDLPVDKVEVKGIWIVIRSN